MTDDLVQAIKEGRAILFAGAGISAVLGVPTWQELIAHIGDELGYDPEIFSTPRANYLALAEYYKVQKGTIGPLRSWMDKIFNVSDDILKNSRIHELIVTLDFPVIYTTNYDRNIENSFLLHKKDFSKIVDVRDIAKSAPDTTQIVKLHGDFDDDDSIVLTETDYFERLSFESPLDIKLRSDALAKTILFIGYSLSDINVRLLLYKLSQAWLSSGHEKYRPKSYIFLSRPDPVQETVLSQWDIEAVTEDVDSPEDALEAFLVGLANQVRNL